MTFLNTITAALAVTGLCAGMASAETRITYKSAKTGSSYYQMGVELAEAMKAGTDGEMIVTIEESQGSVQNVMEARARGGDYVFTTPPALVGLAQAGKAMFEGKGDPEVRRDPRAVPDPVADDAFRDVRRQRRDRLRRAWRARPSCWARALSARRRARSTSSCSV